MSCLQIWCG